MKYHALLFVCSTNIICFAFIAFSFSVDNFNSYINVSEKWVPELRHFCPRTPIVLVATKTDLRYDDRSHRLMAEKGQAPITTLQGQNLAQKVQVNNV